jgi:hypothetical protein
VQWSVIGVRSSRLAVVTMRHPGDLSVVKRALIVSAKLPAYLYLHNPPG